MVSLEPMENRCGACTLCLDSCPTGALERPFYLDASKCLSYLSIEDKRGIDEVTGSRMGDCFFGCDRCQEVCPFNGKEDSIQISLPSTDAFLEMDDNGFKKRFGKTAFARAGLEKLKTNIQGVRS
jgi:epoxyqueuosine reductase